MTQRLQEIMLILKNLVEQGDGIQASMVAKQGLEGVLLFPESFKKEIADIWEPLSLAMDDILGLVGMHSDFGLDNVHIELLHYGVGFCVLGNSDTALIIFIPKRKGHEPSEVFSKNIENIRIARDKILLLE